MKGQYRVVMEIMLFGIGVAIASFVLVVFTNMQNVASDLSTRDQFEMILNSVSNSMISASQSANSTISQQIPPSVSGHTYKLFIQNKSNITALDMQDPSVNVTRNVFKLNESIILEGEVISSAGTIQISFNGTHLRIGRG